MAGRPTLAHAVNTLARILASRSTMSAGRTVILRPSSRAPWQARWQAKSQPRTVFAARVAVSAHRARAQAVAAYARSSRARTHLAATGRARMH